jgi:hypothetical protein
VKVLCISALVAGACALAQSTTSTTYTADLMNGGYTPSVTFTSSDHSQTQIVQSLNGRQVPLEQHEERVLSRAADGTVISEAIVHRYDPTGQLASTERIVTEQRKTPDGGSSVRSTTYQTNVNGDQQQVERRTVDTHVTGSTTAVNTVVDRPGLDGSFQTEEKRSEITEGAAAKQTTTESVYRRDAGVGFAEMERKVITQTQTPTQTVVTTTEYLPGGTAGALQFQEQRVATSVAAPNGTQTIRVAVYGPSADGTVQSADAPAQLKQEQIITHEKGADGSIIETFSVRETSVSEPTHLGELRQISKTVCTGNCGGAPAAPATPKP